MTRWIAALLAGGLAVTVAGAVDAQEGPPPVGGPGGEQARPQRPDDMGPDRRPPPGFGGGDRRADMRRGPDGPGRPEDRDGGPRGRTGPDGPPRPPGMHPPFPQPPGKAARFEFERLGTRISVKCSDDEAAKACAEAVTPLVEKFLQVR